jgi:hypothetical protein
VPGDERYETDQQRPTHTRLVAHFSNIQFNFLKQKNQIIQKQHDQHVSTQTSIKFNKFVRKPGRQSDSNPVTAEFKLGN